MGILNNVTKTIEPMFRFSDWETMGAHVRPQDTRTTEQLLANIDYYAEKLPEVAKFKKELKAMSPEHLGLASDICELGTRQEKIATHIDIRKTAPNKKSLLEYLIERLPIASKENPNALDFTKEVINNTDTIASKYFLNEFAPMLDHPEAGKHFSATKPLIKDIAEATLQGGHIWDYEKECNFVNSLWQFINPKVNPENIEVFDKTLRTVENLPKSCDNLSCVVDSNTIINSKTPIAKMKENLSTFTEIAENLSKQTNEVNLSDFMTKNVNLD